MDRLIVDNAEGKHANGGFPPMSNRECNGKIGETAFGTRQTGIAATQNAVLDIDTDVKDETFTFNSSIRGRVEGVDCVARRAAVNSATHAKSPGHVIGHVGKSDAVLRKRDIEAVLCNGGLQQAGGKEHQGDDESMFIFHFV